MKILYDGYIYRLQKSGGINRYFQEIISRLPSECRPSVYTTTRPVLHSLDHKNLRFVPKPPMAHWLARPIRWLAGKFDLFHPTYYHLTEPLDWSVVRGPVVLTVYDFVFSKYANRYSRTEKLLVAQREAIQRADVLLCISNSTKSDLLERFPECESRCFVTHLAANVPKPTETRSPNSKPYFLFVGSRVFYKNFRLTLDAVALLRNEGSDVELLVAGAPWNDEELKLIDLTKAASWLHLVEYPEDQTLANLYQHAVALIYPSEYEGFGLPPLEAMTLGTPVLTLNTSSLPEVVGEGGILLDPLNAAPEDLAAAASSLLREPDLRTRFSLAARQQASKFHWDLTAEGTLAAYRRAIANSPKFSAGN
jgi:glycosyltransferase involved in cell wall biosynthesis